MSTAQLVSNPSPIGGLNAYDNLAAMPPTDAIRMNNIVPTPYGCTVRKGFQEYTSGLAGSVDTVVGNISVLGARKLFAAAGTNIYDITNAASPTVVVSGTHDSYWQSIGFANSAGTHLVMFNGVDDPVWYNATSGITRLTLGDGVATGTWKNVDPAQIIQATVHQRRIWGVQKNSTLAWFLPADSIYGVANFFDFGPFFKRGGYLVALGTWSADMGGGSDDQLVAVSSEGEAVVFAGTNVEVSTSWALRGVYFVGAPPAGRRFMTNVAGDLMFITRTGVVAMSTVLTSTTVNVTSNSIYSKKIQYMLNDLLGSLSSQMGWELHFSPTSNLMYINVPSIYAGGNGQIVVNYVNTAWCTFSGMNAQCWCYIDEQQYFGMPDGTVQLAWVGDLDGADRTGQNGTNILSAVQQAYSNFGTHTAKKQVDLYRPICIAPNIVSYVSTITYDYAQTTEAYPSASGGVQPGSYWDIAKWGTDMWGGGMVTQLTWRSAEGLGSAASLTIGFSTSRETTWVSTDYTYRIGGPL